MAKTLIGGIELIGNELDISITSSVEMEQHPWLLRDEALNSFTLSGHKSIEVEVLTGKRILVQTSSGIYHDVPRNNDDNLFHLTSMFLVTQLNITCSAADITGLDSLITANKASLLYYTKRRILLNKLNDNSLSFVTKMKLYDELKSLPGTGLQVQTSVTTASAWEFAESNGLNISYWTNGPYADVKITVLNKQLIPL